MKKKRQMINSKLHKIHLLSILLWEYHYFQMMNQTRKRWVKIKIMENLKSILMINFPKLIASIHGRVYRAISFMMGTSCKIWMMILLLRNLLLIKVKFQWCVVRVEVEVHPKNGFASQVSIILIISVWKIIIGIL